jgi:ABC-type transporter Mla maintaining outer membrane lipid asymmetry ATPase subunit MlaF
LDPTAPGKQLCLISSPVFILPPLVRFILKAPKLRDSNHDLFPRLKERINQAGITIFMVEQNANMALSVANRGYVLQTGSIVLSDTAENLLCNEMMQEAYLGGADACETPVQS